MWLLIQTELFPLSEQKTKIYAQEKSFYNWSFFQCIYTSSEFTDFKKMIEL